MRADTRTVNRRFQRWALAFVAFGSAAADGCILPDYDLSGAAGASSSGSTAGAGGTGGTGAAPATGGIGGAGGTGGTTSAGGAAGGTGGMGGTGGTGGTGASLPGGTVEWALPFVSDGITLAHAVTSFGDGGIVAGNFTQTGGLPGGAMITANSTVFDGYVARVSSAAIPQQLLHVQGQKSADGRASVTAVAAGTDGSTFVAGVLEVGIFINGAYYPASDMTDMFVAKFDPLGTVLWAQVFGGPSSDSAQAIALFPNDDIAIVGHFSETADFGSPWSVTAAGNDGTPDAFVARLSGTNGKVQWIKTVGSDKLDYAHGVAVTQASQHVVVAGAHQGVIDLGAGGYLSHSGGNDLNAFVLQLEPLTGNVVWSLGLGDSFNQNAYSVASGGANVAYVGGDFLGVIVAKDTLNSPVGSFSTFVIRLDFDQAQKPTWARAFLGSGPQAGLPPKQGVLGLAARPGDGALVTGTFNAPTDFGMGQVASMSADGFALRLNEDGSVRWLRLAQGTGAQRLTSAAFGTNGEAYVGGYYGTTFTFGDIPLPAAMTWRGFLAKLSP